MTPSERDELERARRNGEMGAKMSEVSSDIREIKEVQVRILERFDTMATRCTAHAEALSAHATRLEGAERINGLLQWAIGSLIVVDIALIGWVLHLTSKLAQQG